MTMQDRHLLHVATVWDSNGSDGFNGFDYGTPYLIRCRWVDKTEAMYDDRGAEFVSKAVVYVDRDVGLDAFIAMGDHTGVADPNSTGAGQNGINAQRVRAIRATTNLRNSSKQRRVIV